MFVLFSFTQTFLFPVPVRFWESENVGVDFEKNPKYKTKNREVIGYERIFLPHSSLDEPYSCFSFRIYFFLL